MPKLRHVVVRNGGMLAATTTTGELIGQVRLYSQQVKWQAIDLPDGVNRAAALAAHNDRLVIIDEQGRLWEQQQQRDPRTGTYYGWVEIPVEVMEKAP